ncbi:CMRF35-like molecule 9 [Astyanax mexicanus]|uniref:CMRF35-like molecule 9 n=1 Tax=Astyanax mexicanus TaxID=7994 RepID=A0A8T2KYK7_ASTMX|nr:CMRF35-like molecule 9 [Astyanax mexicanus]
MVHEKIKVTETEHNTAIIQCPYTEGFEDYPKYFCKGIYKDCRIIIKTDGKERWKYEGRFSLADDTDKKKIVVAFSNLSMNDAGPYACGIEITGPDPFTVVYLTVNKAPKPPKPPKPHQTPTTISISTTKDFILSPTTFSGSITSEVVVFGIKPYVLYLSIFIPLSAALIVIIALLLHKRRVKRSTINSDSASGHHALRTVTGSGEDERDYENDPHGNARTTVPIYQSLNPNTNQSDSVYQSLNPNINQSDSVYQGLNPNTIQSDSVYQSLNPNTNQSDSVY